MQHTGELGGGFLLHTVEPELARPPAGKQHGAQRLFALLCGDVCGKLGKLCFKADQLLLLARAEGMPGRKIKNRLEKIGLSVGVAADEQIHPRHKRRTRLAVVAKIAQIQLIQPHP